MTRPPLASADDARRRFAGVAPLPAERVPLATAIGRVLADAVTASEALPPWPRAAMDGVAVRAAELAAASPTQPVRLALVGSGRAGHAPVAPLTAGSAARIATGGQVPEGADTVVMIEDLLVDRDAVVFTRPAVRGKHIVDEGEDALAGQRVLEPGRLVGAAEIALLAALGQTTVHVHRRPDVVIVSSGDELVGVEAQPGPGQIRDANGPALVAAAQPHAGRVTVAPRVGDRPARLAAAIGDALARADVVLVTGGSSVGEGDHTSAAVRSLGATIEVHGIAVRPGRPTLLASLGKRRVVGLPGVPAAALTMMRAFVVPLLRRLGGASAEPTGGRVRARLRREVMSVAGREDWLPVSLGPGQGDGLLAAMPLGSRPTSLAALAACDGYVVVPSDVAVLPAGAEIEVILT